MHLQTQIASCSLDSPCIQHLQMLHCLSAVLLEIVDVVEGEPDFYSIRIFYPELSSTSAEVNEVVRECEGYDDMTILRTAMVKMWRSKHKIR